MPRGMLSGSNLHCNKKHTMTMTPKSTYRSQETLTKRRSNVYVSSQPADLAHAQQSLLMHGNGRGLINVRWACQHGENSPSSSMKWSENMTHRQTYTQTDRQTDTQTDRQTDIHTDRQTDRHTHRQTDRQTDRLSSIIIWYPGQFWIL